METSEIIKKITFAWWNTSLSPHSNENKASDEHKSYVIFTLLRLIKEKSVDVLCLCEVSIDDIIFIRELLKDLDFTIYDGTLRDGRKKFDLCVIYRSNILEFVNSNIISKVQVRRKIHAGQEVNFLIKDTREPLTLYLAHWSSRMYDHEESTKKILLGSLLRDAIMSSFENDKISNIIILGDFNEEPFNKSITDALFASRDISLVKKTPTLLYNPFWRHMVYNNLHPSSHLYEGCGTYFYKGDESNEWKTFDQIIFSSSFVQGGQWYLNESQTGIFYDEQFIKFIYNSHSKFDHLPVISSIERLI